MTDNSLPGEVLRRFKGSREKAFEDLFGTWFQPLSFYASRLVREKDVAKDIALDTFAKVWEKKGGFSSTEHLHRFMYTVTKNACISWLRSQNSEKKTLQNISFLSDKADPDPDWEQMHTRVIGKIFRLIDDLPDPDSRIIRLSLLEGRSHDQIACELAITSNSVAVKKFRALTMLRSLLHRSEICY